ncbi:hypothetical protein KEM48_008566 [Puccinia striiformis f. sp. tritici PST-130]|nr:hypothetical protein KEM48_008566 [Puccinia striiformis f. sp. tritici PST-130]
MDFNLTAATTATTMAVKPSYPTPSSVYPQGTTDQHQLIFGAQSTGYPSLSSDQKKSPSPHTWTYSAPLSAPTQFVLQKRQVVLEIEVITVINLVPKVSYPNASPVAVTLTIPPPANTMVSNGGWPIINPGSAGACWSDMACNSVCPNFQQNGWYAHCIDAACTQCRCQIISPSMCYGQAWSNATWISNAPAKTIQVNPAIATVTVVVVAQAGPSLVDQFSRKKSKLYKAGEKSFGDKKKLDDGKGEEEIPGDI